jgi:hypothetical protein
LRYENGFENAAHSSDIWEVVLTNEISVSEKKNT